MTELSDRVEHYKFLVFFNKFKDLTYDARLMAEILAERVISAKEVCGESKPR